LCPDALNVTFLQKHTWKNYLRNWFYWLTPWSRVCIIVPLHPYLPSGFYPSGFCTKTVCASHAFTCPAHLRFLELITLIIFGEV